MPSCCAVLCSDDLSARYRINQLNNHLMPIRGRMKLGYGIRGPREIKAKEAEPTATAAASSGVHVGTFIDRLSGSDQTRVFRQQGTAVVRDIRHLILEHLLLLTKLDVIQPPRPQPPRLHLSLLCRFSIDSATFARFSPAQFPVVCATISLIDDIQIFKRGYSDILTRPLPFLIAAECDNLESVRHYARYLSDAVVLLKDPFEFMVLYCQCNRCSYRSMQRRFQCLYNP
jgi:hypothetical protein